MLESPKWRVPSMWSLWAFSSVRNEFFLHESLHKQMKIIGEFLRLMYLCCFPSISLERLWTVPFLLFFWKKKMNHPFLGTLIPNMHSNFILNIFKFMLLVKCFSIIIRKKRIWIQFLGGFQLLKACLYEFLHLCDRFSKRWWSFTKQRLMT